MLGVITDTHINYVAMINSCSRSKNYRPLTERDIYGSLGREELAEAFVSHQAISQRCEYDGNADSVLAEFGISNHMIDELT